MRPVRYTYAPADASLTRFASNVTGATWTLTNTTTSDGYAHTVTIRNDSVTDHSGKTALLTGTDSQGHAQTQTVTLPGVSATVTSTLYFKTLTSIVPSATIGADTMDIGQGVGTALALIGIDWRCGINSINIDLTGTANFTVQQTFDDIQDPDDTTYTWQDAPSTRLANVAVSTNDAYEGLPTAIRLIFNSFSTGASVNMTVISRNM